MKKHLSYSSLTMANDIMICKIDTVELSTRVQPACLPFGKTSDFPVSGTPTFAVGWYIKIVI